MTQTCSAGQNMHVQAGYLVLEYRICIVYSYEAYKLLFVRLKIHYYMFTCVASMVSKTVIEHGFNLQVSLMQQKGVP